MLIRPNPSSGVPVYLQLMDQVRHGIETGALRAGEILPAIGHVAAELVVSPKAVERAYRQLEDEGLIDLRQDAGTLLAFTRQSVKASRHPESRPVAYQGYESSRLGELVSENSRLTAKIAAEVADRAKRDRELQTAREVQERLLPQEHPPIAGLDYAGVCRPALGVGGDYYDFIRFSDTELAVALGDVSGKGIPAALLMATLRAYLHGQTLHGVSTPAEIVRTLNHLVCGSFSTNRYATFFYGHFDSSACTLRYVNAGHPPPLVYRTRQRRREVLRLDQGGPVIGLTPASTYVEGIVTLEPDDLVVVFSDGISEAMNAAGDEWGEERLQCLIGANRERSARELIDRIMRGADAFAAGASQHDDMTLVTMRITPCHSGRHSGRHCDAVPA